MTRRLIVLLCVAILGLSLPFGGGQIALAQGLHTVQDGDTLASIAREHGISVEALAAANGLDPDAEVSPGEDLTVPEADTTSPQTYVVQEGDTVDSIAAQFGVSAAQLIAANDIADVGDLRIGITLTIPGGTADPQAVATAASGSAMIDGVMAYKQSRSLSCEYAAVFIATSVFANPISEEEYIAATPESANPHDGFRGNIDGPWGITDDYGIYAEALVPMLQQRGFNAEVSYGADASQLMAQLDAGRPTLVWFATRGDTGFYQTDDSGTYKLVPYEHVVVAYGYDAGGVYVSDPGNASLSYYTWSWFLPAWAALDGMALAVSPA